MSEDLKPNNVPQVTEEQEIDLIELAQKVWAERKLVFKTCGIAVLVALVVAFSIPKEFSTSVTLAPESEGRSVGGTMGHWLLWLVLIWAVHRVKMHCLQNCIPILLLLHLF